MKGKLEFGCDYLNIMRNLLLRGSNNGQMDPVADAAARLFLLSWDFSVDEIDEANKLFWDRVNSNTLEKDLTVVAKRIADHIRNDKPAQERFVIQIAAIGDMDFNVTSDESSFVRYFQDLLDLRPSEFLALCEKGQGWAVALNYFGDEYAKNRIP